MKLQMLFLLLELYFIQDLSLRKGLYLFITKIRIAFVTFARKNSALKAIEELNNQKFKDNYIQVDFVLFFSLLD